MIQESIQGLSPNEIKEFLNSNAHTIETGEYFKSFDEQELNATQNEFAQLSLKLNRMERELEEIKAYHKALMKPIKDQKEELLDEISHNGEIINGTLYLFDNQETGMMESYNELGVLISSRRLKPEERQLKLKSFKSA